MKRTVIKIDEELCNGCGACVNGCHEGALQLIDGKAVMVSDLYCDGLGACIGDCPVGAITLEEREAEPYDEIAVMERLAPKGEATILAHLKHLADHDETEWVREGIEYIKGHNLKVDLSKIGLTEVGVKACTPRTIEPAGDASSEPMACGCPGTMAREIRRPLAAPGGFNASTANLVTDPTALSVTGAATDPKTITGAAIAANATACAAEQNIAAQRSELRQFPVQLHLVNPQAGFLQGGDLLLAADCTAFASGEFHSRFLRGKFLAIACPKLDSNTQVYTDKLVQMIDVAKINTLTVLVMEVPCCGGLVRIAQAARQQAQRNIPVKVIVLGVNGEVKSDEWM